jgi:DNA (cytosine-5)-methyltransferase 1
MIGIDLFSGAGGMSLGAEWAGVTVKTAVELDPNAAATYQLNHQDAKVLNCNIKKVKDLSAEYPSSPKNQLVVFGGPPCQGFSTSNQRTRSKENPSNWLFAHYLRIVNEIRPDWVVFENVKGILETERGYFFKSVLKKLSAAGYTTSDWVLNAADFGVPQRRSRLFVIGSLHGKRVQEPAPTVARPVTVADAILDLPVLQNGAASNVMEYRSAPKSEYAQWLRGELNECTNHLVTRNNEKILKRYRHIPEGGNWESIPPRLMKNYADTNRCHTGIYKRLKLNEPSVVIGNFRKNMLIHPTQNRGLSVREAARLQSFPDNFKFVGSIGFQQQQVGNAVPPLLAQAVFNSILHESGEVTLCGQNNH